MSLAPLAVVAALAVSGGPPAIATSLGRSFEVRATVTNPDSTPTAPLIAHLNVLSLGPGLYVDPEDWSSRRTRYLPPIPAGGSLSLRFELTAVSPGRVGVYVAVVPRVASAVVPRAGPLVRVRIADRRTLDAGNVLPLAVGVPVLLGLLAVRVVRRPSARP